MIFFFFFRENKINNSGKLSSLETVCMKCQNLFSGKNKKKCFSMLSVENFIQSAKP